MDPLALFKIPFTGLKAGKHEFQMDVDQVFFTNFPESEIEDANGVVDVVLNYSETNLITLQDYYRNQKDLTLSLIHI